MLMTILPESIPFAAIDQSFGMKINIVQIHFIEFNYEMIMQYVPLADAPRRLDLMRHLRREGAMSVRKLAQGVARDYKSVHREVALLISAGLIERRATDEVAVAWDRAVTELDLAA